jgi:hypothetical protein
MLTEQCRDVSHDVGLITDDNIPRLLSTLYLPGELGRTATHLFPGLPALCGLTRHLPDWIRSRQGISLANGNLKQPLVGIFQDRV